MKVKKISDTTLEVTGTREIKYNVEKAYLERKKEELEKELAEINDFLKNF